MKLYTGIHSLLAEDENGKVYIRHEGKCRKYRAMESENNLVKLYPQIKNWWDYEANNGELPEEYTAFSPKKMHFICPDCGAKSFRRISDAFVLLDDGTPTLFNCAYCNNKRALPGYNSLLDLKPDLAEEWSPNNEYKTSEIVATSSKRALWICPTCNGEYAYPIRERELNGDSCPYCNNRYVLPGYNSIFDRHKKLIEEEWCYLENTLMSIHPDNVLETTQQKVWWKCPTCSVKYLMSIRERLMKQKRGHISCTQCRGKRWIRRFNI